MKDYYATLGVAPGRSTEEVREAYLVLAKMCHPDAGGVGNGITIQEVNEAWQTLKDPIKRRSYDVRRRLLTTPCERCEGSGLVPQYRKFIIVGKVVCEGCGGTGIKPK